MYPIRLPLVKKLVGILPIVGSQLTSPVVALYVTGSPLFFGIVT
jgi:hypothetical protein